MAEMGPDAEIKLVRKNGVPIAAILALRHRNAAVYKYGCSDHRFHHLAGMPFLFWRLIEESKFQGLERIEFGRTEVQNKSLVEFKDRLGTTRTIIGYLRYPRSPKTNLMRLSEQNMMRSLCGVLPGVLSSSLGSLTYRHIG
jgi:lipid II:glycine glycyltransferase (peptidoglycan interpeptide bridge formation enzyme)